MKKYIALAAGLLIASTAFAVQRATITGDYASSMFSLDGSAQIVQPAGVGEEIYSNLDYASNGFNGFSHGDILELDDLELDRTTSTGTLLDTLTFTVANFGAIEAVDVDYEFVVRSVDPNTGNPASDLLVLSIPLNGLNLAGGFFTQVTFTGLSSLGIDTAGWDALGYTFAGGRFTSVTGPNPFQVPNLADLGSMLAGPTTVGASTNGIFEEGFGFFTFGPGLLTNMALEMTTPEPASLTLLSLALLAIRRR
jgi:hypothetical protein